MATSILLTPDIEARLDTLVADGVGLSRSEVVRQAILHFSREKAFERLQQAERDIAEGRVYEGDLKKLLKAVE